MEILTKTARVAWKLNFEFFIIHNVIALRGITIVRAILAKCAMRRWNIVRFA